MACRSVPSKTSSPVVLTKSAMRTLSLSVKACGAGGRPGLGQVGDTATVTTASATQGDGRSPRARGGGRRLARAVAARRRAGRRVTLGREDVASPRHGLDARLRLVPEGATQLHQALHQGIVGDERVRPEGLDQLVLGDEPVVVSGRGSLRASKTLGRSLTSSAPRQRQPRSRSSVKSLKEYGWRRLRGRLGHGEAAGAAPIIDDFRRFFGVLFVTPRRAPGTVRVRRRPVGLRP